VHMSRGWVMGLVLTLLLPGCLVDRKQRGTDIDPHLLSQLQPGLSTKSEVLRTLGVPTRNTVIQDREAWVYDYSLEENRLLFLVLYSEKRKTIEQRGVAVLFADDRLYDYLFLE
jgi:outer membrane protein assembly factor BamE (lipoprotein component of BamABCDE complex)